MAGANFLKGGRRDLVITKKAMPNNPSYPASGARKKIHKQSTAQLKTANVPPGKIKIGVRVKQAENVEQLQIVGKNGATLQLSPAPPAENPANNPVALDLAATFGAAADEKWVTYTADWDPATFGKTFDTRLVLNPFECHPNGVRAFMIAITYDALSFANDHYVYGVSVLPGENSQGFPIDVAAAATPPARAKPRATKKVAKKTPKRRR
jgi:hypothetical protein